MDTLIICATVVGLALWLTYQIKSAQRSPQQTTDEQARLAEAVARTVREDIGKETERLRAAQSQQAAELRKELTDGLRESRTEIMGSLAETRRESAKSVADFSAETAEKTKELQKNVEKSLEIMRADNERRLNEMREVVGEKLQKTLEARLGESFRQVSERLDAVTKHMAEVQQIQGNINDLKRVMGNVKTRGVWGETFLESLLSESLVLGQQFVKNFKPRERSGEMVEFAIVMPGQDGESVYLPVDAKFPREDYERIVMASEQGNVEALQAAQKALASSVLGFATDVSKYINAPRTTDFAILFLPTEGLYAEVLRNAGIEKALKEKKVLVAGPSTMLAIINSLRVGFQTLVVQKKSAEIGKLLGAIKQDFGKFGAMLEKVNKKLEEASNVVGEATTRHSLITKKMKKVQELPAGEAEAILKLEASEEEEDEAEDKEGEATPDENPPAA